MKKSIKLDRTKEGRLDRHIVPETSDLEELAKNCDPETVFAASQLSAENIKEYFSEDKDMQEMVDYDEKILDIAERFANNCSCTKQKKK